MKENENISRPMVVSYIYEQAQELGIDWRFPCNPTINDLCERGELADVVPITIYLPTKTAKSVIDGELSLDVKLSS